MTTIEQYIRRKIFWIKDWLQGGQMWSDFKEVQFIMSHPKEGFVIRQQKLADILAFAKENTAFYKQYASAKTLADFPVVNKSIYKEHYQDFCVPIDRIPWQKGPLHIQKTSGSTGTPFEVPQDTRCRTRRLATLKAMNELVGFHSFNSLMHLRSFQHYWDWEKDLKYDKNLNIVYADNANLNDDRLEKIVSAINTYHVKFIRGYVTCLDAIAQYANNHNIILQEHPTFIAGGEMLLENVKQHILSLACKITSQYANEENGIFGQSEINGNPTMIVLNRANCIIEILKVEEDKPADKGELGRVVVTDLTNHAFPMIRYDIGDLAAIDTISKDGDIMVISDLAGRKQDMIQRTDGTFVDMFNSVPKEIYNSPSISQWQLVQESQNEYRLRICLSKRNRLEESDYILLSLKEVLGENAKIFIEYVKEIPVLNSGKRKIVINEWKH